MAKASAKAHSLRVWPTYRGVVGSVVPLSIAAKVSLLFCARNESHQTDLDDLGAETNDVVELVLVQVKVVNLALLSELVDLGAPLADSGEGSEVGWAGGGRHGDGRGVAAGGGAEMGETSDGEAISGGSRTNDGDWDV